MNDIKAQGFRGNASVFPRRVDFNTKESDFVLLSNFTSRIAFHVLRFRSSM